MKPIRILFRRLRALFHRDTLDREMDEEMRFHLEMQARENAEAGVPPDEATHLARQQFGRMDGVKESVRDRMGVVWMESLIRDVNYTIRSLRRSPGFALTIVLMLGLGIGSNTAVFSVVNSLLLRPHPIIADPHNLWAFITTNEDGVPFGYSTERFHYETYRDEVRSLRNLARVGSSQAKVRLGDAAQRQFTEVVSGNYFSTVGIQPALGRLIGPSDDNESEANPCVVISYTFWQNAFNGSDKVIDATLEVNDAKLTIIGVAPAEFSGLSWMRETQVWVPSALARPLKIYCNYQMIGRLAPDASREQAIAELNVVTRRLSTDSSDGEPGDLEYRKLPSWLRATLEPAALGTLDPRTTWRQRVPMLTILFMGAVTFVLLIACANAANLLLARATHRRREIAIRLAMGAGRLRLVRQLFTESLLLAFLGGAVGIAFALWGTRALLALRTGSLQYIAVDPTPDWRVLGFTLAVALATGVIFGLAPAWDTLRFNLNRGLNQSSRTATEGGRFSLRNFLVIAQVAVSLVLLAGAGLCLRSFVQLNAIDPGFDLEVVTARISLDEDLYTRAEAQTFVHQIVERLRERPEVASTTIASSMLPLSGGLAFQGPEDIEGHEPAPEERFGYSHTLVAPDYFRTLGIPIVRGREFDQHDIANNRRLAIVNERFVAQYWPGQDPIGKQVAGWEVVGVARDSRLQYLWAEPSPHLYQIFRSGNAHPRVPFAVLVKPKGPARGFVPILQREIKSLDESLEPNVVETLRTIHARSLGGQRLLLWVTAVFAIVALIMAAVGLYGLMAFMVAQRTREFGIRVAVGAQRGDILSLVLKRGLGLTAVGVAFGLVTALGVTRFLQSLLYGLSPTDPLTFTLVAFGFLGIAALACYLPARRAAKIDPAITLRAE